MKYFRAYWNKKESIKSKIRVAVKDLLLKKGHSWIDYEKIDELSKEI
ncbi:hypothetical protein [Thermodesulfovibrio hydrogeniphilus]